MFKEKLVFLGEKLQGLKKHFIKNKQESVAKKHQPTEQEYYFMSLDGINEINE